MDERAFLFNLGIALGAALLGGLLARLLRLPVLVGYLLAGIAVGPHTPGIIASAATVKVVAKLGVALLMFAVGVHFSLDELRAVRRTALLGGGVQIVATVLLGLALGMAFGWGTFGGLFFGCALALSSTAVMMKVLEERGEIGTAHGKVMLGILVVQDLALVAMVVLLPALALFVQDGAGALSVVGWALLRAALFLAAVVLLATRAVPALLHLVARAGSREVFLLTVVSICLVTALAAEEAGLGIELGAFLAGIIVSETDYAHEVFAQVRPLRDVFASLFFVSIGMLLDPSFLAGNAFQVGVVVLAIVIGKALISLTAIYALGWHGRTAILGGLGLAQIGEFSFVLATVGSAKRLIPAEIGGIILAAALVTLLLAPFVYSAAFPLYGALNKIPFFSRRLNRTRHAGDPFAKGACSDARVLVLGYGRIGQYVSDALRAKRVPHLVVDYDAGAQRSLLGTGVPALYGDATSPSVLERAEPRCVQLAVVALPEADATEMAVRALREIAPQLPVLARVHRGTDIPRMRRAGAEAVIYAEFEAGTEMIRQTLDRLGFADPEVDEYLQGVRLERYREEVA